MVVGIGCEGVAFLHVDTTPGSVSTNKASSTAGKVRAGYEGKGLRGVVVFKRDRSIRACNWNYSGATCRRPTQPYSMGREAD